MKDQEITVGSRWTHEEFAGITFKILALGAENAFCLEENGFESSRSLEHIKRNFTPIKETRELYLYVDIDKKVWVEDINEEKVNSKQFYWRSEHPITFVEVE